MAGKGDEPRPKVLFNTIVGVLDKGDQIIQTTNFTTLEWRVLTRSSPDLDKKNLLYAAFQDENGEVVYLLGGLRVNVIKSEYYSKLLKDYEIFQLHYAHTHYQI